MIGPCQKSDLLAAWQHVSTYLKGRGEREEGAIINHLLHPDAAVSSTTETQINFCAFSVLDVSSLPVASNVYTAALSSVC